MREHFRNWREERCFGRRGFPPQEEGWGDRGFAAEGEETGRRGDRHWRFGRGFGRPFDHGGLRLVILAMIAEKPRHGYEIIRAIEDRFGGSYAPSPGVVYPTLTMFEELGYTTVEEANGKKLYTITPQGTAWLAENKAAADAVMARFGEAAARHGGGPAPQLIRSVENLKMALRLRQRRGPLTEEQLRTIVAAIDAAAVAIERS